MAGPARPVSGLFYVTIAMVVALHLGAIDPRLRILPILATAPVALLVNSENRLVSRLLVASVAAMSLELAVAFLRIISDGAPSNLEIVLVLTGFILALMAVAIEACLFLEARDMTRQRLREACRSLLQRTRNGF
jgi:hypothetical protein